MRSGGPSAADAKELRIVIPFGLPALAWAIASLVACYATLVLSALFDIASLGLNPHVQAVIMWVFALLAVFALWQDRKSHGSNVPVAIGALAAGFLVFALYISYTSLLEAVAYTLLVIAAFINQNVFLSALNETVRSQAQEIEIFNQSLAEEVESQVQEIDRLARLKQFLAPQVADLVVSEDKAQLLDTHRRFIACLFCDIRNFTAVSEELEPEEVIAILQAFHEQIGALVTEHGGTIGYRAGDGLMTFFNDPIPCDEPVLEAVRLAFDIRTAFDEIRESWAKRGLAIGLGIGIAGGFATLGLVGFPGARRLHSDRQRRERSVAALRPCRRRPNPDQSARLCRRRTACRGREPRRPRVERGKETGRRILRYRSGSLSGLRSRRPMTSAVRPHPGGRGTSSSVKHVGAVPFGPATLGPATPRRHVTLRWTAGHCRRRPWNRETPNGRASPYGPRSRADGSATIRRHRLPSSSRQAAILPSASMSGAAHRRLAPHHWPWPAANHARPRSGESGRQAPPGEEMR